MPTIKEKLDSLDKAMQEEVPDLNGRCSKLYNALWSAYQELSQTSLGKLLNEVSKSKQSAFRNLEMAQLELNSAQTKVNAAKAQLERAELLVNIVGATEIT